MIFTRKNHSIHKVASINDICISKVFIYYLSNANKS